MKANPGGEIAPSDVVGREPFITRAWEVLRVQSILMVAERRIGKTTVIKKMRSDTPDGVQLIYRDVEGCGTGLEFAEGVARDVHGRLTGRYRRKARLKKLFTQLAGFEIGSVVKFPPEMAEHWRSLLEAALEDHLACHPDTTWVFVWDELTLMLQKIRDDAGERAAMAVLDTLRGLRQEHPRLRMIYTGSVGLHHVVSRLYLGGVSNDPTNDMRTMEVTELRPEDGKDLASALIEGEGLWCVALETTAAAISQSVDHIPFYIHHVVGRMKDLGTDASSELAASIVTEAIAGAQDEWHMSHYRRRLDHYYDQDHSPLVLRVLDELCASEAPLAFAELMERLRSTIPREGAGPVVRATLDGDEEPLRHLLDLLARDHYLRMDPETGRHSFRYPLIRRWWSLHRSLSS